jgi:signal peptidase I
MFAPQKNTDSSEILASLYREALRGGTPLWFRIVSGSMYPLFHINDDVFIEPAQARTILPGDIAAFETPEGLVVHRILYTQESKGHIRLLQMADAVLRASWIEEQAVVGRVVTSRRGTIQVNLQHPIAKWWGRAITRIRYRLYLWNTSNPFRLLLRAYARVMLIVGCQYTYHFCRSFNPLKLGQEKTGSAAAPLEHKDTSEIRTSQVRMH